MSLSINNNSLSLSAQRSLGKHVAAQESLINRLTAGTRINKASDDAAGQAIAARMDAGLRGNTQAMRAISDGSSMLQVADGALANIGDSLQRLRELAVASGNGSYGDKDRTTLQNEANEILNHINQVAAQTQFNGEAIFSQDRLSIGGQDEKKRAVIDGLKTGWLSSSEKMLKDLFGLEADGVKLTVNLEDSDGASNTLASVSGTISGGKFTNVHLNIDMADFGTGTTADGGGAPFYSDRIIAHEMAHAIMSRSMNFNALPQWFIEGTAELIHGADERVNPAAAAGIVSTIAGGGFSYEGGYVASRYLHDKLKGLGVEGGIKGVMQYLTQNQSADLSTALNAVTGGRIASTGAFLTDFGNNGVAYIGSRINVTNADTGAIGGFDADGKAVKTARSVVADTGDNNASDGLSGFDVVYPELGGVTGTRRVQVQVGDNAGDLIDLQFGAINASALGLANLDMKRGAVALLHVDQALEYVNQQRVVAGASGNRLDMAADSLQAGSTNMAAAKERIEGIDYAGSAAGLTRAQILQQAASAMLAQANSQPRAVLSLLR
ncbi:flagellinolysin [Massilia sp. IC2-476]|uniref:flagellinolysin n=1 Tax=Massilia sp. IC2-476 TaxID=2887199 RepID=UPI001D109C89|nr:flagellinolysin [Massilia sp. IC2-476]MCC2971895.1 flagellinolysin [Massilia sp. IC2-476]